MMSHQILPSMYIHSDCFGNFTISNEVHKKRLHPHARPICCRILPSRYSSTFEERWQTRANVYRIPRYRDIDCMRVLSVIVLILSRLTKWTFEYCSTILNRLQEIIRSVLVSRTRLTFAGQRNLRWTQSRISPTCIAQPRIHSPKSSAKDLKDRTVARGGEA